MVSIRRPALDLATRAANRGSAGATMRRATVEWRRLMKTSAIAFALTALVTLAASPSFAQSLYRSQDPDQMRHYMRSDRPIRQDIRGILDTINGPHHEVIVSGHVVGADPDPTVRLDILRDNEINQW
jgi:hypothetical protein